MIQVRILVGIAIIVYAQRATANEVKWGFHNKAYPHVVFIMADDLVCV